MQILITAPPPPHCTFIQIIFARDALLAYLGWSISKASNAMAAAAATETAKEVVFQFIGRYYRDSLHWTELQYGGSVHVMLWTLSVP